MVEEDTVNSKDVSTTHLSHDSGSEAATIDAHIDETNVNIGGTERWATAIAGGTLATYGLIRRSPASLALAAVGRIWSCAARPAIARPIPPRGSTRPEATRRTRSASASAIPASKSPMPSPS